MSGFDIAGYMKQTVTNKNKYDNAKKSGNIDEANKIANAQKTIYDLMDQNGYSDQATKLKNSSAEQAVNYLKNFDVMNGKSAIRPKFYELGKQYGMSGSDIDNMLKYDETTSNVSFGGTNLGKANDVNGVSYWDDDYLTKAFDNVAKTNGFKKSEDTIYNQGLQDTQKMINDTYNSTVSDKNDMKAKQNEVYNNLININNPLNTDWGKAIMSQYTGSGSLGEQAINNSTASDSSSNGGNIDSYAAANAKRQRLAFTNAGVTAVQNDWNNRINNALNTLNSFATYNQGIYDAQNNLINQQEKSNQQVFDNGETRKTNQMNNWAAEANITGYVPEALTKKNNQFYNSDGQLKQVDNIDYQEIINNNQAILQNPNATSEQKANAQNTINQAYVARADKILNNYAKYGQYAGNMVMPTGQKTAAVNQANADRDAQLSMSQDSNYTQRYASDNNLAGVKDTNAANLEGTKYTADANVQMNKLDNATSRYNADNANALDKELAEKGLSRPSSNSSTSSGSNTNSSEKEQLKQQADDEMSHWLYSYDSIDGEGTYKNYDSNASPQYIAAEKITDSNVVEKIKTHLIEAGYTNDAATNKIKEYRNNIAKQIAQIENKDYTKNDVINKIKQRYGWEVDNTDE